MKKTISKYSEIIWIAFFSVLQMMGYYLQNYGSVFPLNKHYAIKQFLLAAGLTVLLISLLKLTQRIKFNLKCKRLHEKIIWKHNVSGKVIVLISWTLLVLSWLPVLLAYYPGVFAYDASNQVLQVINNSYSTHHPLVHTLLLGKLFLLGHVLGDNNLGVLLYSILQMMTLALGCTYLLVYVYKSGISKMGYIVYLVWYMFFPVHSILAISTTKDVYFAVCCMFNLVSALFALNGQLDKKWNFIIWQILVISTCGMVAFRNNAIYAIVIACVPIYFLLKQKRRFILSGMILGAVMAIIISNILAFSLKAEKGSVAEMMSVPLQQMARVGWIHQGEMDRSLREELYYFIPEDIMESYSNSISDGIKDNVDVNKVQHNKMRFIKTYIKLGIHYPREYIDAFAALTQGYWYLGDKSHSQIYGVGNEYHLGYLMTNCKDMPTPFEVTPDTRFQGLEEVLEGLFSDNEYQRVPLLWIVFSPAFYGWLLLICIYRMIKYRKYTMLSACCPILFYQMSLLLGPTCLIRYVYALVVCIPVILYGTFGEKIKNERMRHNT